MPKDLKVEETRLRNIVVFFVYLDSNSLPFRFLYLGKEIGGSCIIGMIQKGLLYFFFFKEIMECKKNREKRVLEHW